MIENRVAVRKYGRIPRGDRRLVSVPSVPGESHVLHHLAADALARMSAACEAETGIKILVTSGWRPHRWISRAEYESYLVATYSKRLAKRIAGMSEAEARATVIAYGRKWVAFDSPHETGLALDIGSGGLDANSEPTAVAAMKTTELYKWLERRAADFGFTPYLLEPWHWEFNIPFEQWRS